MSTLTNNANNSSSSNNNSNNNNNSSSNNTNNNNNSIASYYQQYIQHYQLSPQGGTAPPSAGGSPTVTSINNNNNNNGPTSDNIHTINNNNNISTSSSSTSSNQSQPTTAANTGSGGGGGVVGGILGVREVSAKLFLPFARAKMMHSSSSAASTPAKDQHQPGTPLDGTSMAGMNATPTGTPSATPSTTTGGSSAGMSGAGRASSLIIPKALNVVLHGYHRKHKTNKKKYFVVYGDVPGKAARLEYFDSEKKFKQSFQKGSAGCDGGTQPKRTIVLRTCFNINKRHDLKKQIISLYTKDDSFCIVFESEEELNLWLRTLLRLQRGEDSEGDPPRPTFEHVWEVYVQRKGLGDSYGILGNYRLCITDKTLSLVRIGSELTPHQEKRAENVEFLLASVRRCGHSQRYFYLEVGRSSKTGAGEIWMEVQDSIIAQNMYTTIMKSAKSKDDNLGPMIRIRSSSANAASKPTSMLFRRQTHTGQKPINCSPSSEDQSNNGQNSESSSSATSVNTVVLVGSPPKAGTSAGLPYSAGAPGAKPRPPVVANPSLPACAENSSSLNTSTTCTITTAACTSTTAAAAATACSSSFVGPFQSSSDSSYHAPMIVPFAGITPAVSTGNVVASTPAAMFSSNSSLASIGSCSPSDAYVPLVPPGHASTSQASGGGGGGGVPTRGGLVGSPRLGVTAQSPNYRRTTSVKKSAGSDAGGGSTTSPLQATRSHQTSRHYHQQQLPSTSSHHSHHPTHLPHPPPPHHPAPYPHHGTQAVATGAVVGPHPATPSVVSSSGCCSIGGSSSSIVSNRSSSNYSSNSSSTSTIAVTNEFSSSSTDHVSSGLSAVANMSSPAAMGNSTTAAMMMLPPSPSASMSKFHHYASTRQGGKEVPGSGGGITLSNLLATITHSLVGVGGGGAGSGAANGDSGPLATANGGSGGSGGSSSGGSFSNFSTSSRSSSRCSSTVSIQTVATVPLMGPPPPPPPPLPPLEQPALCGVRRRHTRSLSHHSANAIYLTGAKPLRRLRSTLRRHSVSVTSASATAGVVFHQRALSLPSAPMLGHSPHSNTHHLGALHAHSGGSGSSVRSSSQCSVVAAVAAGTQGGLLPSATGGSQHIVTLSTSLSSSSASCAGTGTIQPVHHRTRSLPLTEESAIRLTAEHYRQGGGGWWQPHHHAPSSLSHYNHLQQPHCSSAAGASNHRKSSSAYLPAPPTFSPIGCSSAQCPMHAGGPNGGGGWSPPVSDVLCTSPPHRHQYELSPEGPQPFASLVPSRSSMESIIEDQRYLPMDLKKPAGEETPEPPLPPALPAGSQLTLISRLLRSSNLQQHASTSSAGSGSGSASSPGTTLSAGKIGLLGLKMAMMAEGRGSASSNGGCCSCSSPSQSQCSSGSNCLQAISSNSTTNTTTITTTTSSSHKSTNGSSPAALRRLSAGRTASGTISRSVAIARERCDSLPSRNRTTSETMPHQQQQQQQHLLNQQQQQQHHHQLMLNSGSMPPPRMIPSSNRPHSVHISHSHSPPVNSSPLSPPPPATYSTGSDGSSLSIDESTDSFITGSLTPDEGQGYPKVINQLNSGCSIPEENSEEFIKDYGHIDLSAAGCGISQHDDFAVPAARRGGSPAPPSTVGSVEGSAYMEMCSPSGSSPGDPSGSCYMAMSPVADFSRGLCSSSSAHSRASSLAEDIVDGYVPMSMPRTAAAAPAAPPTEEYMLMDPTLNGGGTSSRLSNATAASNNAGSSIIGGGGMSSAASSCSITSGTPSADLRLSLEKVPAYIGQSDEHEVNDRPFRTYSVGSRPELIKRKLRVEMLSSGESSVGGSSAGGSASSRQRAFSVGSRAKVPRCSDVYKGYSAAPVIVSFASTSSQGSMLESSNNNSSSSTSSISHAGSYGASIGDTLPMDELAGGGSAGGSSMGRKSGSGSLLPDGAGGGKPPSHGGSHGRMSDLMEIDYSSPRQQPARPSTRSSEPSGMEDYLDMSGNNNEEEQRARGQGATSSGYVEMRPGRLNSQSEENDYLNMTPGGGGRDEPDCCPAAASIATSSPIQIQHHAKQPADGAGSAHSSSSNNNNNNNYLEMYPRAAVAQKEQKRTASAASTSTTTTATKVPSEDYLNMAPLMISSLGEASGSEEEKMHGPDEEPLLESSSAPPDGYMEMSWNHHGPVTAAGPVSSSASSSATSSARTVPTNGGDDYMNMSCGSGSQSEDASRTYSAPITIQPGAGKCRLDLSGESKVEAGANIPNYLPLGQHPDARKSVHHPHHQSAMIVALQQHLPLAAQAPIQTTTGQQSGSIGFSPSKPAETTPERARCDSRDSGIVTPSGSQPTIFPFSPASPTKPFAPAQDEPMGGESLDDLSQNYAELSLGRQQQQQLQQAQTEPSPAIRKLSTGSNRGSGSFSKLQLVASQPDYVNYCPATPPISGDVAPPASNMPLNVLPSAQSRTRSSIDDDGAGDYALMNPASSRKLSTTSMGSMGGASLSPAGVVPPGSSAVGSITPPVLVARKSTLLLSSPQMGFKPIASSQDAELLLQSKAVPHATANSPKALNLGRRTGEPAFSFTEQQQQQMAPLQRSISTGTRPNSVNSELIGRPIGTPAGPSTPGAASHSSTIAAGSTRPSSANSERLPVISATSSSASSTSTLCESKNQSPSASSTALAMVVGSSTTTSPPSVPGSRPDSVSSITDPHIVSRPPSVSSERELHYASLDLPPCSSSGKQAVAASPFAPGTMMLLAAAAAATTPAATSSAAAPVTKMDVDEPLPGSSEARTSIDSSSPSPTTTAGLQQQQQPVRCAAFTYAQIDFVRSQAQSQQGQTGAGPAGANGPTGSNTTTTTNTPPQSSQA
uniref:pneumococcal serine-rich repeat protein isoform X3 n=1 Tax=Anopheles coluzzii TaxID=1518534 RepID=UPI0020FFB72C|nr:pneumococcal serine-rich repeat protein isoform X3 [Anopheles coluzzii]